MLTLVDGCIMCFFLYVCHILHIFINYFTFCVHEIVFDQVAAGADLSAGVL